MSDLENRLAHLSPEKRAFLSLRLKNKRAWNTDSAPSKEELPLSFAQERLWMLDQLEPSSSLYTVAAALRLSGRLDVAAVEQSLGEIIKRHEVLRAAFVLVGGRPIQVTMPATPQSLSQIDLQHVPLDEREAAMLRLATAEAQRSFDLTHGPLLRTTLIELSETEHVLLLSMHQIASDDWSVTVLGLELSLLYQAFTVGKPPLLPKLPIQFADFVRWQREWLQAEVLQRQLAYWKQQLGDRAAPLELPSDWPRHQTQTYRCARHAFVLPQHLVDRLLALCRQENVTLFITTLAAFQVLLARYSGQNNICVGTSVAGRIRPEVEGLIGPFANTLVIRFDLADGLTYRELLRQVRDVSLNAYAHADLPFELLVEELAPAHILSHTPLFRVMFKFGIPFPSLKMPGIMVSPLDVAPELSPLDLQLIMMEQSDGLQGVIEYSTDLFNPATIKRMVEIYQAVLERIVAHPDLPVEMVPLPALSTSQRQTEGVVNVDISPIATSLLHLVNPTATSLLLAVLEHVLHEAGPKQAEILRRCAIPRWFDADVIALLRDRADGNERVLDMLHDYSFVRQLDDHRYTYHDDIRASLLAEWREQRPDDLRAIQVRLADSFTTRATTIRPPDTTTPTRALPVKYREYAHESLYHRLMADLQGGLSRLDAALMEAEATHDLAELEALIEVASDVGFDRGSELPLDTFLERLERANLRSAAPSADSPKAPGSQALTFTSTEPPFSPGSGSGMDTHLLAAFAPDEGYELFRRAVIEHDDDAWTTIYARYRPLLLVWTRHRSARTAIGEHSDDIADRALARAWAALSPERFVQFPNLAALLAYLRSCVTAAVIDYARAQASHNRVSKRLDIDMTQAPEHIVLNQFDRAELWRLISKAPTTEQERTVLTESFVMDLPPRAIQARHPDLFASIADVYSAKRSLLSRLQRNPDLQRLHKQFRSA